MGKEYVSDTELIKEWDFIRNKESPGKVSVGSSKKVWWKCDKCGYEWKAKVCKRSYGQKKCKWCVSLAILRPEIAAQWYYERNKNSGLTPKDVTCGSHGNFWWKCNKCGEAWPSTIKDRTSGCGCPYCGGKKVCNGNSLATQRPGIVLQWDYEKNTPFTPNDFTCGSGKVMWWKCEKCGCEWSAIICNRAREKNPSGCPQCSNGTISKISQQWLDELNISVENREITLSDLKFRVDAFVPETNKVYEFFGDYWHGNPERFDLSEVNKTVGKTFGELYEETKTRVSRLEEAGYKVVYIWERDFKMEK